MGHLENIDRRISRRSYLATPIAPDKRARLQAQIDRYNREADLAISWIEDGSAAFRDLRRSYGLFHGVRTLLALKGWADDPDLEEKLGYFGELLVLEATGMDLGSCWVGGTFNRETEALAVMPGEKLVLVITLGNVPPEQTPRERMVYRLTHGRPKPIGQLYVADRKPPKWFMRGVRAASLAPSALGKQPVRFLYQDEIASAEVPNDAPFQLVDLGIAKSHFAIVAGGIFQWGNGGVFLPDVD